MHTTGGTTLLDDRWTGYDGLFGGYVVARLVDAAAAASSYSLVSLSVSFVSRVVPGEADLRVESLHRGRSTELVQLVLLQKGKPLAYARAELLPARAGLRHLDRVETPEVPGATGAHIFEGPELRDLVEVRPVVPSCLGGRASTWCRLLAAPDAVGLETEEAVLAIALDLPRPGLFGEIPRPAFVPTIELTLHVAPRSRPLTAGGWLYLTHDTSWATRDSCIENAQVWSQDGDLLAQATQTRGVRWT